MKNTAMNRFALPLCWIALAISLAGCNGNPQTAPLVTALLPTLTREATLAPTQRQPTPTQTALVTYSPETRLRSQCLQVAPSLPSSLTSRGTVVLQSRVVEGSRYKSETLLQDMLTGKATQIVGADERQSSFVISPNRELMAYERVIFDAADKIVSSELVVTTADGERLSSVPWEQGWVATPAWLDNQHLLINLAGLDPEENSSRKPATMLVLDPFSNERQVLSPYFPGYIDPSSTGVPWWNGWSGVVYDPTLSRAIYPRSIGSDQYTYAIWDNSKGTLQKTLENVFVGPSGESSFPMPVWLSDGSQFVLRGLVREAAKPAGSELYRISRDGQVEQLTNLASVMNIQDSNLSWSPDGRYVAMFLNSGDWSEQQAHVGVLDTQTLDATDYCVTVTYAGEGYGGGQPPAAIWSPDAKQLLVQDWFEEDHQRVILIDIEKALAAEVAKDVEAVGWMK